jgi:hypothetical protein
MMRRFAVVLPAALACVLWAVAAGGMYTPNPAGRWVPNRFFLAGDFQYNASKDIKVGNDTVELQDMVGLFVRPSYSIVRNLVAYGRLGFQQSDVKGAPSIDAGFAGGAGIQGAYEFPGAPEWALGGSFDYLHWSGDQCTAPSCNATRNIDWDEFQFAPAISLHPNRLPVLTPYFGLLFDFVDARNSISESDPVGLLIGTNIDPTPHVRLDLQLRIVNETGFVLSAGYLF